MTKETKYVKKGSAKGKILDEITGSNGLEYFLVEVIIDDEPKMRYWLKTDVKDIEPPKK